VVIPMFMNEQKIMIFSPFSVENQSFCLLDFTLTHQ